MKAEEEGRRSVASCLFVNPSRHKLILTPNLTVTLSLSHTLTLTLTLALTLTLTLTLNP